MKRGEVFGDLALDYAGRVRAASIKCLRDCVFATINERAYKQFLKHAEDFERDTIVDFLKKEPLFLNWSRAYILKILRSINRKKFY